MKATINGITYEGTLEEIKAIAEHMTLKISHNPYIQTTGVDKGIYPYTGTIAPSSIKPRCSNVQCFCDGSCLREENLTGTQKFIGWLDRKYDSVNNT